MGQFNGAGLTVDAGALGNGMVRLTLVTHARKRWQRKYREISATLVMLAASAHRLASQIGEVALAAEAVNDAAAP